MVALPDGEMLVAWEEGGTIADRAGWPIATPWHLMSLTMRLIAVVFYCLLPADIWLSQRDPHAGTWARWEIQGSIRWQTGLK